MCSLYRSSWPRRVVCFCKIHYFCNEIPDDSPRFKIPSKEIVALQYLIALRGIIALLLLSLLFVTTCYLAALDPEMYAKISDNSDFCLGVRTCAVFQVMKLKLHFLGYEE